MVSLYYANSNMFYTFYKFASIARLSNTFQIIRSLVSIVQKLKLAMTCILFDQGFSHCVKLIQLVIQNFKLEKNTRARVHYLFANTFNLVCSSLHLGLYFLVFGKNTYLTNQKLLLFIIRSPHSIITHYY